MIWEILGSFFVVFFLIFDFDFLLNSVVYEILAPTSQFN